MNLAQALASTNEQTLDFITSVQDRITQASNGVHHRGVDIRGQCAWQRLVKFGNVGGEDQPP